MFVKKKANLKKFINRVAY